MLGSKVKSAAGHSRRTPAEKNHLLTRGDWIREECCLYHYSLQIEVHVLKRIKYQPVSMAIRKSRNSPNEILWVTMKIRQPKYLSSAPNRVDDAPRDRARPRYEPPTVSSNVDPRLEYTRSNTLSQEHAGYTRNLLRCGNISPTAEDLSNICSYST